MKIYNYFLFRTYYFFKDTLREKDLLIFSTTLTSSLMIYLIILTIGIFLHTKDLVNILGFDKMKIIGILIFISLFNYLLFIKRGRFLNSGFRKGVAGGWCIAIILLLIIGTFIYQAQTLRAMLL